MSANKLISIKNPIVSVMDDLGLDHDKFIPLFTRWAVEAEKEIGSWLQYTLKRAVLPITNCTACLPCDAVYVQIAILGDLGENCADLMANACGLVNLPNSYGTSANTFLVVDMGDTSETTAIRGYINHQIQNNKLVFEQDYDGQSVTIQYLAFQTDCDGFLEIGENHQLAIQWYITWKYLYRKNNLTGYEYGKMNKAEVEWHRECSHARAQDAEITESDRRKIVGMWHNPYAGIGLSDGMNTTLGNNWSAW